MYSKVLIPSDGSKDAERVFPLIEKELSPGAEVVLLQITPPGKTYTVGGRVIPGTQLEENERSKLMSYCRTLVDRIGGGSVRWRCEVAISESVPKGIVDFATQEGVELIAMYTHDRKGIARLVKGSIAQDVRRRSPIEVKVFKPEELTAVT